MLVPFFLIVHAIVFAQLRAHPRTTAAPSIATGGLRPAN
jgi:hypothetical protein